MIYLMQINLSKMSVATFGNIKFMVIIFFYYKFSSEIFFKETN